MNETTPVCNYLLILGTGGFSYLGFRSRAVEERYIFEPERILAWKEYYRLVTSAFLHADLRHLIFNMLSLYFFGPSLEFLLGKSQFLLVYFAAVVGGNLLSLYVHRHHDYRAYGASGGVCGIIFAYILFFPGASIGFLFLPLPIPGWIYAIGYILFSFYGMKEHKGDIGHDAHLGGAIIGFLLTALLHPQSVRDNPRTFVVVLVATVLLLIYLWFNPMFLPASSFIGRGGASRKSSPSLPKHRKEQMQVDAVLEKIARSGFESLTAEEKALLGEVSGKYQRRADSKKPDSGLAI